MGIRHFVADISNSCAERQFGRFSANGHFGVGIIETQIGGYGLCGIDNIARIDFKATGEVGPHVFEGNASRKTVGQFAGIAQVKGKFVGVKIAQFRTGNVGKGNIAQRKIA